MCGRCYSGLQLFLISRVCVVVVVGRVCRYGQISKDIIAHHEEGLIRIRPNQFSIQSYLIRLPAVCCVVWLWLMIV